jgi:hypothetical protein
MEELQRYSNNSGKMKEKPLTNWRSVIVREKWRSNQEAHIKFNLKTVKVRDCPMEVICVVLKIK